MKEVFTRIDELDKVYRIEYYTIINGYKVEILKQKDKEILVGASNSSIAR